MSKQEEARLILELYDLRREDTMRISRDWYFREFNPQSKADFTEALMSEHSAHQRMVESYWEMAAALVNGGAISLDLFASTNGEHLGVFMKIEPLLADIRKMFGPRYAVNIEKLIDATPDGRAQVAAFRERMKAMHEQLAARQAKASH